MHFGTGSEPEEETEGGRGCNHDSTNEAEESVPAGLPVYLLQY